MRETGGGPGWAWASFGEHHRSCRPVFESRQTAHWRYRPAPHATCSVISSMVPPGSCTGDSANRPAGRPNLVHPSPSTSPTAMPIYSVDIESAGRIESRPPERHAAAHLELKRLCVSEDLRSHILKQHRGELTRVSSIGSKRISRPSNQICFQRPTRYRSPSGPELAIS